MSEAEPANKKTKMSSSLAQLKQYTTVVADTGDFEGIVDCLLQMNSIYTRGHLMSSSRSSAFLHVWFDGA